MYKKTFVLTVENKKEKVLLLDVLTQIRKKKRAVKERNVGGYAVILGSVAFFKVIQVVVTGTVLL